jgi:hypothetical protein
MYQQSTLQPEGALAVVLGPVSPGPLLVFLWHCSLQERALGVMNCRAHA